MRNDETMNPIGEPYFSSMSYEWAQQLLTHFATTIAAVAKFINSFTKALVSVYTMM